MTRRTILAALLAAATWLTFTANADAWWRGGAYYHNPYTGRSAGGRAGYNPYTGGYYHGGAAYNPYRRSHGVRRTCRRKPASPSWSPLTRRSSSTESRRCREGPSVCSSLRR